MTTHRLTALSGSVRTKPSEEGKKAKPVRLRRGDAIPANVADGEVDRLVRMGCACTEAAWHAGESVPHHNRKPHRGSLAADPRSERDPEPVEAPEPAPQVDPEEEDIDEPDADAADEATTDDGLDVASMSDDVLRSLWEKADKPLISDLLDGVGSDAELAQRVLAAEDEGTGGHSRPTLVTKLEAVIAGGGE